MRMFIHRMEDARHCLCIGPTVFTKISQETWVILNEHIHQVWIVIDRYLDDVPNSCQRFEENQVLFLLLTLGGDLKWHYRVNELYPKVRVFREWKRCSWCDWEPMGISLVSEHLRDESLYDQPLHLLVKTRPHPLVRRHPRRNLLGKRMSLLKRKTLMKVRRKTLVRVRRRPLRRKTQFRKTGNLLRRRALVRVRMSLL